jgi:hypothetical protein
MRKSPLILGTLPFIVLFSVCAGAADWKSLSEQLRYPVKRINRIYDGDVFVDGHWRNAIAHLPAPILPKINAVKILCDRRVKICREFIAVLFTPEDGKHISNPFISIMEHDYKVLDWSDDIIRGIDKNPITDIELRISVKDNFAERIFRDTKARKSETSGPSILYVWTLE